MYRHEGPLTALSIALPGGLYLSLIMDHYGVPQTALTVALPGGLYLAIIIDHLEAPKCPYYSPAWKTLHSLYNGPL
jgi:hypothetical protein